MIINKSMKCVCCEGQGVVFVVGKMMCYEHYKMFINKRDNQNVKIVEEMIGDNNG